MSLRLFRFDNDKDAENKRFWAGMLGAEMGEADVLESAVIGSDDPYADENTQYW